MQNSMKIMVEKKIFCRILGIYENVSRQFEIRAVKRIANLVVLEKIMLKNACLGAKIGFDAEENEPSKVW